jgi:hypothetical protein
MPTCVGEASQATQVAFAMDCCGFNRQSTDLTAALGEDPEVESCATRHILQ